MLNFSEEDARKIKNIEKITNHDVKAVEYYIKTKLGKTTLKKYTELGVSGFINKPWTANELFQVIRNLFNGQM